MFRYILLSLMVWILTAVGVRAECLSQEVRHAIGLKSASFISETRYTLTNRTLCGVNGQSEGICTAQAEFAAIYAQLQENITAINTGLGYLTSSLQTVIDVIRENFGSYYAIAFGLNVAPLLTFNKVFAIVQKNPMSPFLPVNASKFSSDIRNPVQGTTSIATEITSDYQYLLQYLESLYESVSANQNDCLNTYLNVSFEAYCVAGSANASEYVKGDTNFDMSFGIKTHTPTVGAALSVCQPLIEAYCILTHGLSVSNTILNTNNGWVFDNHRLTASVCLSLRNLYNCTNTFCSYKQSQLLVNQIFSFQRITFLPSFQDKAKIDFFINQLILVIDIFGGKSSLIQETGSFYGITDTRMDTPLIQETFYLLADDNGAYLALESSDSGAEFRLSTAKTMVQNCVIVCLILTLF